MEAMGPRGVPPIPLHPQTLPPNPRLSKGPWPPRPGGAKAGDMDGQVAPRGAQGRPRGPEGAQGSPGEDFPIPLLGELPLFPVVSMVSNWSVSPHCRRAFL